METTDEKTKEIVKQKYVVMLDYMKDKIIESLSDLENGYGYRKWYIQKQTGIPMDVLTVLLKQLKYDGKIELIMIWDECTGLPDGSGYCLTGKLKY